MARVATALQHRRLRCAVYTRKSSEEGLEQEFNSLHAQREACEAFIRSQRHEGWVCLPQSYGDGGFSGRTLDRPALQRLLADIAAGKVDVVVTYKIDRLTRALSDFAKITEIFEARGVSFVVCRTRWAEARVGAVLQRVGSALDRSGTDDSDVNKHGLVTH